MRSWCWRKHFAQTNNCLQTFWTHHRRWNKLCAPSQFDLIRCHCALSFYRVFPQKRNTSLFPNSRWNWPLLLLSLLLSFKVVTEGKGDKKPLFPALSRESQSSCVRTVCFDIMVGTADCLVYHLWSEARRRLPATCCGVLLSEWWLCECVRKYPCVCLRGGHYRAWAWKERGFLYVWKSGCESVFQFNSYSWWCLRLVSITCVCESTCISKDKVFRCVFIHACVWTPEIFHHSEAGEQKMERDFELATKAITAQSL